MSQRVSDATTGKRLPGRSRQEVLDVLAVGTESFVPFLQPDGTLNDPVFDCPTQYGSAYFGWCNAVLADQGGAEASAALERAQRVMTAALAHTADPSRGPWASGFDRRTLSVVNRLNHRDFTWPPILKTYLTLRRLDADLDRTDLDWAEVDRAIAAVDVEASFRARPPSNWAAVWMSGEWLRMQAGLSPTTMATFDGWIDAFFEAGQDSGFDLEAGLFFERGLPNAYDLFTRAHFTDLLLQGYDGRNRDRLETFLASGLRRSLAMQLSDGSMASGYRSTGQTWVLGAQVALFTGSVALGLGGAAEADAARHSAWRAFGSLAGWQRDGGPFSPVQNALAPQLRVGYEGYTADGHYAPLALAFLASAVTFGFGADQRPQQERLDDRPIVSLAEGAPTHRGVLHRGRISAALQSQADGVYDATGIVDLTFGSGRLLQFVSSARHLAGGPWLNPGLAVRPGAGATLVTPLGARRQTLASPLHDHLDGGLAFETILAESDTDTDNDPVAGQRYRCEVRLTTSGLDVREATPGASHHRSLLIPYLRDPGTGPTTAVTFTGHGVRFSLAEEWVEFSVDGELERASDLPFGYENRRGLCGLVRLDLCDRGEDLRWSVTSSD
ncbi:hypothetical protein GCM10009841_04940 [Microlunatus panaciterrae]|uniref:Heparinase II/III-like protein n=1 Tax=Microlunatus panaciterrae TaxID=400768 RepID=A0ABS2RIM6_9ACTN|nr:hypothetical protein [Microlunatus panaciterrae]MBM7798849.1 hypothetical protein [Microlunatus panaciterrae]